MVRAVLFDIDGVIIRPERYFSATLPQDRYPGSAAVMDRFYSSEANRDCDRGVLDPLVAARPFAEAIGWDRGVRAYFDAQYAYEARFVDRALLARVAALRAAGPRCYLATCQNRYRKAFLVDELRLPDAFDGAFFSCDLGCLKTERRYWEAVVADLGRDLPGLEPGELLFLDDLADNVAAAEAFGLRAMRIRGEADIEAALTLLERDQAPASRTW